MCFMYFIDVNILGSQCVYIDKIHKIRHVTDIPDFMYFIDVNIQGSQHVHSIC